MYLHLIDCCLIVKFILYKGPKRDYGCSGNIHSITFSTTHHLFFSQSFLKISIKLLPLFLVVCFLSLLLYFSTVEFNASVDCRV